MFITNKMTNFCYALYVISRICLALATFGIALAQDSSQQQKEPPPKKDEPAPLFGGKLGTRSSQKNKESATLGFNGIDPSGKVDQQMLAASPGATDAAKVKNMDSSRPTRTELAAFVKE